MEPIKTKCISNVEIILFSGKYHIKQHFLKFSSLVHSFVRSLDLVGWLVGWMPIQTAIAPWYYYFYALLCINLHKCFYWCHYKMGSNRIVNRLHICKFSVGTYERVEIVHAMFGTRLDVCVLCTHLYKYIYIYVAWIGQSKECYMWKHSLQSELWSKLYARQ